MSYTQRKAWAREGGALCCRGCLVNAQLQRLQYERERATYAAVKELSYPKPTRGYAPSLRRLNSGEKWDGTRSFRSGWQPPSALAQLLEEIKQAQRGQPGKYMGIQRCPCGFVPPTAPGPLAAPGADDAERCGPACPACCDSGYAALEDMPCMTAVEEESLSVCSSGCGSPRADVAAAPAGAPPPACQQREQPGQAAAGEGAEEQRLEEQRQWERRRRALSQMRHARAQLTAGVAEPDSWREARSLGSSDDEEHALDNSADGSEGERPQGPGSRRAAAAAAAAPLPPPASVRCC